MLTEGIQTLQKLKKKGKGVTKAIIEEREKQVGAADAAEAAAAATLKPGRRMPCALINGVHGPACAHGQHCIMQLADTQRLRVA
jgi:hypothetical protein